MRPEASLTHGELSTCRDVENVNEALQSRGNCRGQWKFVLAQQILRTVTSVQEWREILIELGIDFSINGLRTGG